jgi:hypothetical protein
MGGVFGGVIGYYVNSFPHCCICALIGSSLGFALGVALGVGAGFIIGAFVGYKYTGTTRKRMHKIFMKGRKANQVSDENSAEKDNDSIKGVVITDADDCECMKIQDNVCISQMTATIAKWFYILEMKLCIWLWKMVKLSSTDNIKEKYACCKRGGHEEMKKAIYEDSTSQQIQLILYAEN